MKKKRKEGRERERVRERGKNPNKKKIKIRERLKIDLRGQRVGGGERQTDRYDEKESWVRGRGSKERKKLFSVTTRMHLTD